MNIKAVIFTTEGYEEKDFDVEIREGGKLHSDELITWIVKHENRISNMFRVFVNGKEYIYSI